MGTKYQTTKEQCQLNIDKNNNVCDSCGRKIKPLKTVDNSGNPTYWAGCMHGNNKKGAWGNFTSGVSLEIFKLAEKMVCDGEVVYRGTSKENKLYWFQTQVSGVCSNIQKIEYSKKHKARKTKKEFLINLI